MRAVIALLALALATQFAQAAPAKKPKKVSVQISRETNTSRRALTHVPRVIVGIGF